MEMVQNAGDVALGQSVHATTHGWQTVTRVHNFYSNAYAEQSVLLVFGNGGAEALPESAPIRTRNYL